MRLLWSQQCFAEVWRAIQSLATSVTSGCSRSGPRLDALLACLPKSWRPRLQTKRARRL